MLDAYKNNYITNQKKEQDKRGGRMIVRITSKSGAKTQIYNMTREAYDALIESWKIPDDFKTFSESKVIFLTDDILTIEVEQCNQEH